MGITEATVHRAIAGDLGATADVVEAPREEILHLARRVGTLAVTGAAAERVLREAASRPECAAIAAHWSRLARNGLLQPGSRDRFDVRYDPAHEDAVAAAVLRLDDLPELPISADELEELLDALRRSQ